MIFFSFIAFYFYIKYKGNGPDGMASKQLWILLYSSLVFYACFLLGVVEGIFSQSWEVAPGAYSKTWSLAYLGTIFMFPLFISASLLIGKNLSELKKFSILEFVLSAETHFKDLFYYNLLSSSMMVISTLLYFIFPLFPVLMKPSVNKVIGYSLDIVGEAFIFIILCVPFFIVYKKMRIKAALSETLKFVTRKPLQIIFVCFISRVFYVVPFLLNEMVLAKSTTIFRHPQFWAIPFIQYSWQIFSLIFFYLFFRDYAMKTNVLSDVS